MFVPFTFSFFACCHFPLHGANGGCCAQHSGDEDLQMFLAGDPTFAPATIIAPAMISPTTKSKSKGDDWVFSSG